MLESLINIDLIITKFLSNLLPHSALFNSFFSFFSLRGSSILIWILVIGIVVILEERKFPGISKRDKKFIFLFSLTFLLTGFLTDIVLKNIFMRDRPFMMIGSENPTLTTYGTVLNRSLLIQLTRLIQPITVCPIDFSFPSTHAATAFAAATILTFFDKKRKWFYYFIAILISYSRIFLGCHYFFDVFIGGLIGYLLSKLLLKIIIDLL
jgi:undecaprenyl-diphosphatase